MAKEPNNPVLVDERGNPIGHREGTEQDALIAAVPGDNVPIHKSTRFGFGFTSIVGVGGVGIGMMLAGLTATGLIVALAGFLLPAFTTFRHDVVRFWREGNATPDTRAFLALSGVGLIVLSAVARVDIPDTRTTTYCRARQAWPARQNSEKSSLS